MSPEKRRALQARAEALRLEAPKQYKIRVALLVALGYSYVGGIFFILLGLSIALVVFWFNGAGVIAGAIGAPIFMAFIFVALALWPRMDPPEGVQIRASDYPELRELLDDLRAKFKGPAIHRIYIDSRMNAAIMQTPRLGIFGWYRNDLVLGLPLLYALTPEEVSAVIAHEYGHLCGADGKFSSWIYRVRYAWASLLEDFDQTGSMAGFVFDTFFHWYIPYFEAYSFALARANEYAADRFSVQYAGSKTAAQALTRINLHGLQFNDYWRAAWLRAHEHAVPPADIVRMSCDHGATLPEEAKRLRCLQGALGYKGSEADTHPPFRDRIEAMGETAGYASREHASAAAQWLGARLALVEAELEKAWAKFNEQAWQKRHQQAQALRPRLDELEAISRSAALDADEALERASLTLTLKGDAAAKPLLEALLQKLPDHPDVLLENAKLLADEGDNRAFALFDKAIGSSDDEVAYEAGLAAYQLALELADSERAHSYENKLPELSKATRKAEWHRANLAAGEVFEAHGLTAEQLQRVKNALANMPLLRSVWLVRRSIKQSNGDPIFVLGIAIYSNVATLDPLLKDIAEQVELPGRFLVVFPEFEKDGTLPRLRAVADSRVHHVDPLSTV